MWRHQQGIARASDAAGRNRPLEHQSGGEPTALEILAQAGRFRIVGACGRMVVGYWPENDPEKKTSASDADTAI